MIKEIKFTDNALKQIANLLSKKDDGSFFRIAIKGGGCSGFQYEFTFEKSKNDDDLNFENILIDKTSADLLKGSEVDYVSELIGESFKFLIHKLNLLVAVVFHSHFNDYLILEC
jgi:iron-sulfur cluster assembly accessory protein